MAEQPLPTSDEGAGRGATEHRAGWLALRVLAAAAVAAAAVGASHLTGGSSESSEMHGAKLVQLDFASATLDRNLPVNVVVPKGARDGKRALLIFLHGHGADHDTYLVDQMYRSLSRQGGRAPVVAFPFGDDSSYWHDRSGGRWGSYVLDELMPKLIDRFEIEPDRVGIGGISMGGFGAFNLARLDPGAFCAVGGHSAALWADAGDTPVGAFDDAADFDRNDVLEIAASDPSPYSRLRTWVDAGAGDPFLDADRRLADELSSSGSEVTFKSWPGRHDSAYWDDHWGAYVRFYAVALHRCGKTGADEGRDKGGGGKPAPKRRPPPEPSPAPEQG